MTTTHFHGYIRPTVVEGVLRVMVTAGLRRRRKPEEAGELHPAGRVPWAGGRLAPPPYSELEARLHLPSFFLALLSEKRRRARLYSEGLWKLPIGAAEDLIVETRMVNVDFY